MPETSRPRPDASATLARGVQHKQRSSPVPDAVASSGRCDSLRGTASAALGRTAALGCAANPIRREHPAWACLGIVAMLSVAIWEWPVAVVRMLVEVAQ